MSITLYDLNETARLLCIGKGEVLDLIDAPNGPKIIRVDGASYFPESHLKRYVEDREVPAVSPLTPEEITAAQAEYDAERATV